ncbi:histidine kinase dimerization/phospho-acceptor domain-containing protein, partial [Acetobacter okinawensis]|uniref:histidine kinase dimerization/phospho-acceptor domain-containing protein n=1 Tax=Acetobacter okinawensis TaxID=1076594 RepID=UPI000557844E
PILDVEQQGLLDALGDQTASAIESVLLAKELDQARLDAETDKLRGALLTSISHDLRTPLASILGATSSLKVMAINSIILHVRNCLRPFTMKLSG